MSMELSITLPPGGFIIRDLFLSGLYVIAREGSATDFIVGVNAVVMRFPSRYAFIYGFEQAINALVRDCFGQDGGGRGNINLGGMLGIFRRNYKSSISKVLYGCDYTANNFGDCMRKKIIEIVKDLEDLGGVCKDQYNLIMGSCGDPRFEGGFLPLLFPETMESARWFGGWDARKEKLKLDTAPVVGLISLIGLCRFSVIRTGDMWLIAPIDSLIGSVSLLSQVIREPASSSYTKRIDGEVLNRLSQAGRFLVTSLLIRGGRFQKILNLAIMGRRVEVIEDVPASFLARFMNFSTSLSGSTVNKLLRLISNEYVDELRDELSRGRGFRDREQARKQAEADVGYVMNVISKAVTDSLNGHITPEEAVYLIARESFMRVPKYAEVLDSKVLRDIKDALDIQLLMGG